MKDLKKLLKYNFGLLVFLIITAAFFYQFILFGKIPIPADTIVGMYHPWRDVVWDDLTAGVPFKNFLITDPVRQQFVWKELAVEELRKGNFPLWNPYSFAGAPLLANFQTAIFYPLNFLFFLVSFESAWGLLVMLQPILGGTFLFYYLRCLGVSQFGSLLGSLTFAFSGFSIAWLEWNTIGHVVAWLPLTLLAIEKLSLQFGFKNAKVGNQNLKTKIKIKNAFWFLIFTFSLLSSFFAGHLQIFFYSFLVSFFYLVVKIIRAKNNKLKFILSTIVCYFLFVVISSIQWSPTFRFIAQSARNIDQGSWLKEGWFLPWQNFIQFLAPDFFGNPSTLNYWGIWNYGEFVGYIGILPLIFAIYSMVFVRNKKTIFFTVLILFSLIFLLPNPIAKLPYKWQIPLLSTSQPTRLMFVIDFSLVVLSAFGIDFFLRSKNRPSQIIKIIILIGIVYQMIWLFAIKGSYFGLLQQAIVIAKRNLVLPTILFFFSSFILIFISIFRNKAPLVARTSIYIIVILIVFDLFRFGWKFTPFVKKEWIFPSTKIIDRLIRDNDNYRIISLNRKILPPNFSIKYRLQDVSGYDPLYLKDYARLISSWEKGAPDFIDGSFNRILTPQKIESFVASLMGIKYVLSLNELNSVDFKLVEREGETYLYINQKVFPRVFFVEKVINVSSREEELIKMFELKENLRSIAVTSENISVATSRLTLEEQVEITDYQPNYVKIEISSRSSRLLVLTDLYYPIWRAYLNGKEVNIHKVDYLFRAVLVPEGNHILEFKTKLI